MRRRSFLVGACSATVPLLLTPAAIAAPGPDRPLPARKLDRLCLSSSSYRANYAGSRYAVEGATPQLSHLTFPRFVRERFGLRRVELWDQQFGPEGHTLEQCRAVRAAADAAGVSIVNIEVEDLPNLGPTDRAARADAVAACRAWLDKGKILGVGSIRVNVSRRQDPVDLEAAVETLRAAAEYGRSIGVRVLLENHGGYTAGISDLVSLVKAIGHEYCRLEVDWGAWSPPGDRYADVQSAMPYVLMVSAKGQAFDEATYEHTSFDIPTLVRNAEAGGFRGIYSIELFATPAPRDTDRAVRSFIKTITDNMR